MISHDNAYVRDHTRHYNNRNDQQILRSSFKHFSVFIFLTGCFKGMRPLPMLSVKPHCATVALACMFLSAMICPGYSIVPSYCKIGGWDHARSCQISHRPQFVLRSGFTQRRQTSTLGLSMMFDQLSGQLSDAMRKLSGQATITDKNIESALKQVKRSLLEADVNIDVASGLVSDIRKRAVGMAVIEGVTPAQQFIKIMSVGNHQSSVVVKAQTDRALAGGDNKDSGRKEYPACTKSFWHDRDSNGWLARFPPPRIRFLRSLIASSQEPGKPPPRPSSPSTAKGAFPRSSSAAAALSVACAPWRKAAAGRATRCSAGPHASIRALL